MQSNLQHLFSRLRPATLEKLRDTLIEAYNEYAEELVVDGKFDAGPYGELIVNLANIQLSLDAIDANM